MLLIQTEWAQNLLIGRITKRLSRDLNTEVSIKRIRLGFFDKLSLEGTLIRDQQKDTLLYAGKLKMEITDWFFIKKDIELKYIGLENALINLHRTDSVWNYQFIIDSLAPTKPQAKKTKSDIQLYLKTLDLENVYLKYKDEWVGQDMVGSIGSLELTAEEFNITRKKIFINSLTLDKPAFYSYDYEGKRPKTPKKKKPIVAVRNDSLEWNLEGWDVLVNKFSIRDGTVSFERESDNKKLQHFDPDHILFSGITGTIQQFSVTNDTLSGKIDLKATERSGFTVNRLKADLKFHPRGMIFSDLDIQTPHSRLRDYYAMRYENFNRDMNGFLSNVKLEASFQNSKISSKDIAYFARNLRI